MKGGQAQKGIAPLSMSQMSVLSSSGHRVAGICPGVRAISCDSTDLPTAPPNRPGFLPFLWKGGRCTPSPNGPGPQPLHGHAPVPLLPVASPGQNPGRPQALCSLLLPSGARGISKPLTQAGAVTGNPPPDQDGEA